MIKSYIFITETRATDNEYSMKCSVNNHKINTKIFKKLLRKVRENKQYKRLYTIDNSLSAPSYSTRKITTQFERNNNER